MSELTIDKFFEADGKCLDHDRGCVHCSMAESSDDYCEEGKELLRIATDIFLDCKKAGLI